jgi:hypothetical protein
MHENLFELVLVWYVLFWYCSGIYNEESTVHMSLLSIQKLAQHLTSSSSRSKEVHVKQHA